ncbi:Flp family type IVb pilin [Lampropedia puyangensis]|uniref:Flp family type IVb pilin n=1 Tax=Lampropedia puyangensis TaxID=1330072 RepID=A0A4S8EZE6_9BURK|nr:Flp family type IVb pilin [Lampropedia puyangensis]THT99968.1 Flp family type IVb pilin [Lampropedia puyangensis]
MTNIIKQFWKDEEGATAIEYGLIAGLIAVAIIVSVGEIGTKLKSFFEFIAEKLGDAPGTGQSGTEQ